VKQCSECGEFPCARLAERSKSEEGCAKAFNRLPQLKSASGGS
jgi:hypothetical protein